MPVQAGYVGQEFILPEDVPILAAYLKRTMLRALDALGSGPKAVAVRTTERRRPLVVPAARVPGLLAVLRRVPDAWARPMDFPELMSPEGRARDTPFWLDVRAPGKRPLEIRLIVPRGLLDGAAARSNPLLAELSRARRSRADE